MDRISELVNVVIAPSVFAFYGAALSAVSERPLSTLVLFMLAVLVAALARSLFILAATFMLALLALLAGNSENGVEETIATILGMLSLAILCAWTLAIRGRFSRLKTRLRSSLADAAATKELLDREIAWRQASGDKLPSP